MQTVTEFPGILDTFCASSQLDLCYFTIRFVLIDIVVAIRTEHVLPNSCWKENPHSSCYFTDNTMTLVQPPCFSIGIVFLLPYLLDQTPRLLFISLRNFVRLLFESGY